MADERNSPGPVVVGVDGSAHSHAAVDFAAAEAAARGLPLRIVHAYVWPVFYAALAGAPYPLSASEPGEETTALVDAAAERARAAQPGLVVSTAIIAGAAGPILIDASRSASLVVIGSRAAGRVSGLLAGGVVGHLSTHAASPVVVVHPPVRSPADQRVAVGLDGTPGSLQALRFGADWAQRHGMALDAICALPYVDPEVIGEDAAAEQRHRTEMWLWERMGDVIRAYPAVDMTVVLAFGQSPARVLLQASESASIVVVGSRGHGELAGLVFGSIGSVLVHRARCPVAVVPRRGTPVTSTATRGPHGTVLQSL